MIDKVKYDLVYFENLLNAPSPSGIETEAIKVWDNEMSQYADKSYSDKIGNSAFTMGKGNTKLLLSGHIDEVSSRVANISDDGIIGYTAEEKFHIAKEHLIPKQLKEHGLKASQLRIEDETIHDVIQFYTKEAGVRTLERNIASLCRKAAKKIASKSVESVVISVFL